jgi:alkanesulfonate monooxygenase SsuD/methylene tetrahydromethanopterin reductase-like flavin-dependent oxidoreductase (luciferase family)
MSSADRQMHLGVLGTGNHMAGWRRGGAFTAHMELPVMQEIARIAEAGKFDLLFISDSMATDPTESQSSATLSKAACMCCCLKLEACGIAPRRIARARAHTWWITPEPPVLIQ